MPSQIDEAPIPKPPAVLYAIALTVWMITGCSAIPLDGICQHRARQQSLCVDAGRMHYLDIGPRDGPPVLLVHGVPTSSWVYRDVAADLARRGCRVIVPDLIGYGTSDKPRAPETYTSKRQAARLFALMDALAIERWTQVCHNLGGFWTWQMIACQPQRIDKLVIMNTTAYRDGFRSERAPEIAVTAGPLGPPLLHLASRPRMGPRLIQFGMRRFVGNPDDITDTMAAGYWLPFSEGTGKTLRTFARSLDDEIDRFPWYAQVVRGSGIPAMIIWGARDPVMDVHRLPQQFATDLAIPPERIFILPDAGHLLMEDAPYFLSERIAVFAHTPTSALR